jgi:hypothetical protein
MHPRYNLKGLMLGHPFSNPDHLELFAGHLRQAGWTG